MNTAQRIRCALLIGVMLVMVSVFVVYRREPPHIATGDRFDEKPLILRKNLALQIGDRVAAENQRFVPIPDNAVPIEWDRVEKSHRPVMRTSPPIPSSIVPPFEQRDPGQPRLDVQAASPLSARDQHAPQPTQPPSKPRYHRIVDGETLRDIAAKYLGSPERFMDLFYANRAVLPHPDVLPLGAKIVIPEPGQPLGSNSAVRRLPSTSAPPLQSPQYLPARPTARSTEPPSPRPSNETPWRSRRPPK